MKTQLFILLLSIVRMAFCNAQENPLKAQEYFLNGQFPQAVKAYEELQKNNPSDLNIQLQLARAYKANGQANQSLPIYKNLASQKGASPELILEYADYLRSEADYVNAKAQYLKYAKTEGSIGNYLANSCDFAMKQSGTPKNCQLEPVKIEAKVVTIYKDELVKDNSDLNQRTSKEAIPANPSAPQLAKKTTTSKKLLDELLGVNTLDHSSLSFSDDGKMVAFCEQSNLELDNNIQNKSIKRQIYLAKVDADNNWSEIAAFPYNNSSYSVCYPNLVDNGSVLYFSSNMAGGFGGFDLYVSTLVNNKWTSPQNLGAIINSPGNEISPYYKNGDLFFSSDWHTGFGGFDIFRSSKYGLIWLDIENLGACVNSTKDDYNFALDSNQDAYFNSNRSGSEENNGVFKTSKILLKSNNPDLRAISNNDVSIKSALPQEDLSDLENISSSTIITTVDDPSIKFLSKEQQSTKLYFVQVAAISNYTTAAEARLKNYTKYGNVYKTIEGQVTKIRIGGYATLNEALALMKTLRKNGFKDIFVVADVPTEGRCILLYKSSSDFSTASTEPIEGKLKIRVAEFKAPDWFDSSKINDLGKIEHWTKNGWTIIVLGSYNTPSEAISVLDKLKTRGFKEAYIVLEENGRLYRQN